MLNKVMIIGNLGQDPELKHTPTGSAVCNFSVATTKKWKKDGGEEQTDTQWHRIVAWKKLGELCNQYLSKGKKAFIEGELVTRSWEDKDGNKRYTTEIIAKDVKFLSSNSETNTALKNAGDSKDYNVSTDVNFASDDIPF